MSLIIVMCAAMGVQDATEYAVSISTWQESVPLGDVAVLEARVARADGRALPEKLQLFPFLDGKRWGHHAAPDDEGKATFWIPFPRAGAHEIAVYCQDAGSAAPEFWMWHGDRQNVAGPVWFQRVVSGPAAVTRASVWAAADDEVRLFLNGSEVVHKAGWSDNVPTPIPAELWKAEGNVLSAWANNGGGPAGVLLRLELETEDGSQLVVSNEDWHCFTAEPSGWPGQTQEKGQPASLFGRAGENAARPSPWPTMGDQSLLYVDPETTLPSKGSVSNALKVTVTNRPLVSPPKDPGHLVGAQWETWFTPLNAWWRTAQGVPLLGFYNSLSRDITRQHMIWLIESGVDFIMADWSNHIWFSKSWNDIGTGSWEIINATTAALDELVAMREEGFDVPKFTLLTGISHVPAPDGPRCVNEQLAWIYDNYVSNPKYAGLWQEFEGKPLIMPLNLGATYLKQGFELDDRFCIRYMGAGTDHNDEARLGLWSWMDHAYPGTPVKDGVVESMTASVGCFEGMGWLGDRARGRRNGATLVEDWAYVMQRQPQMVQLHQFNEFTGASEGQAHGHSKDQYFDSYSIELSDDFEPVALDQAAYRGEDGYGFYYLNLTRALVDLYRENPAKSTVLAIQRPTPKRPGFSIKPIIQGDTLELIWTWAGKRPETNTITINDVVVLEKTRKCWADIDLSGFEPGELRVRVTGDGSQTRYPLLWDQAVRRLDTPVEAWAEVVCVIER